jgi:tRNA (guanine37-N1)-methyltransferase
VRARGGRDRGGAQARELAKEHELVLVCGRYAGFDERIGEVVSAEELSIGDYVLAGGELAALVVIEAVTRLVPGVLGNPVSAESDSLCGGLLEHPLYTRPRLFRGRAVPDVLVSGDHSAVARWRRAQSLLLTRRRRPDLLRGAALDEEDRRLLGESEP